MGKFKNKGGFKIKIKKKLKRLNSLLNTGNIDQHKKATKNWSFRFHSHSAIRTLQMDMNEWQEAFDHSGNPDISFLLGIAQDLLNNRNADEYDNIYKTFLAHFPNGIPKIDVYISNYGYNMDILNGANDSLQNFVKNHPTQEYLDALSHGEEKIPELLSSDPMRICI